MTLFCEKCGCSYGQHRAEGETCGDQSGGVNERRPCDGLLRREAFSLDVHNRQRASMYLPAVERLPST